MLIKVGCEIQFTYPTPSAVVLMLSVHPSISNRLVSPERLEVEPWAPMSRYTDVYGNTCDRVMATTGRMTVKHDALIHDNGQPDPQIWNALQHPVQNLPSAVLLFLLSSRYCEVDSELKDIAWTLFGKSPAGWPLVQAICNFVHNHIRFDYMQARATRTALDAYREQVGVCRDYMHLAIAFCRCLNVPARYCTGYLADIGVPPPDSPMDFCAWFEVFLGGKWHPFDARNNVPRIGRVLIARGRDAADVALTTTFGVNQLESFKVWADEVPDGVDPNTVASKAAAQ